MAERRMFARTIIDSDAFLDMPLSTQALYFHLSMRADDDGFLNNPKKIMRMVGASEDELKVLLTKKFLIGFESGVIVIKHWKIHNYIRNDRYKPTLYIEEKSQLNEKENKAYTLEMQEIELIEALGIPDDNQMETQDRLGKDSIGKDNNKPVSKPKRFVPPSVDEVSAYCSERKNNVNPQTFVDHYESNGWMRGKNKIKDWKACVRTWEQRDKPKQNSFNNFSQHEKVNNIEEKLKQKAKNKWS